MFVGPEDYVRILLKVAGAFVKPKGDLKVVLICILHNS